MSDNILKVKTRALTTRGALNKLRISEEVPAVLYAPGQKPQTLSFKLEDFEEMAKRQPLHQAVSVLVDEKEKKTVVIKEIQRDVVSDVIIHVDFQEALKGRQVKVKVPVKLNGESYGVKNQGGVLQYVMRRIEVKAEADKIPLRFEYDVTELRRGDAIFVKDLSVGDTKIVTPQGQVVGTITGARGLEEEAAAAAAAAVASGEVAAPVAGAEGAAAPAAGDKAAPGAPAAGDKAAPGGAKGGAPAAKGAPATKGAPAAAAKPGAPEKKQEKKK